MSVGTFDSILRISKNWKQLEESPSRDWLNKSWYMYGVNLISTDFPRIVTVDKASLYFFTRHFIFLYMLCCLNIFQVTSFVIKNNHYKDCTWHENFSR